MTIHKNILIAAAVIFVLSLFGNVYMGFKLWGTTQDPLEISQKEIKDISQKLSKLIVLPTDETPTLATVSDPEKLRNQPFFANAKTGFKVLVYSKAQKAILFDPFSNKIVEVAPINSNQSTATSTTIR